MKLYCMCRITGQIPDYFMDARGFGPQDIQVFAAPNRFGKAEEKDNGDVKRPVILRKWMRCVENGVMQKITDEPVPNMWPSTKDASEKDQSQIGEARRHYPDVDVYLCENCGATIIVE